MTERVAKGRPHEALLAGLLRYGTWLASCVTVLGVVLGFTSANATDRIASKIVGAGVGLFIALPILRVLLMLAVFVKKRDYRLAAVTGLVFATIVGGLVLGLCLSNPRIMAH